MESFRLEPAIKDTAISRLEKELKVFYTYAVLSPRNNSIYAGVSRQHPYRKMGSMAKRVRQAPEFDGFWGYYGMVIVNAELNKDEAVEAEKRIIKRIREGTRYKAINKSDGGELGYPLSKAISNDARRIYHSYMKEEVAYQSFWSARLWEMEPRPVWSTETQLPKPPNYFKTMTECIDEVAQDLIAKHLEYVALNRSSNSFATERDDFLAWLG